MARSAFLGMRMNPELRTQLERIAHREERSISQICEMLLRGGVAAYEKEGSKYLQRFLSKQKPETEQSATILRHPANGLSAAEPLVTVT
jgi:hypothetical protein